VWIAGLVLISGVAVLDPAVASGVARLSFASTAIVGIGLIIYLGIQGTTRDHARAELGDGAGLAGRLVDDDHRALDNDIVQPALSGVSS